MSVTELDQRQEICKELIAIITRFGQGVMKVNVSGKQVTVTPAKEGEFRMWEEQHGSMRRYDREITAWSNVDFNRFLLLTREASVTFYVHCSLTTITVYPPRHLAV